jgi:hypothetical protein
VETRENNVSNSEHNMDINEYPRGYLPIALATVGSIFLSIDG